MVARVSGFGFIVITQLFVGHLGELSLAAYAIQQTVFLRFTNGILDVIQLASAWIQSLIPSSGFVFQKALKLSVASHSFSSLQRCWILPKRVDVNRKQSKAIVSGYIEPNKVLKK
ncbi:uncharacterized protein [Euphorbia lathyris]|uniref:uncharacterized protein isoform X4 n=1 Tax=Euphorbia lathyris TaxID=212925 RepID=UPI003313A383